MAPVQGADPHLQLETAARMKKHVIVARTVKGSSGVPPLRSQQQSRDGSATIVAPFNQQGGLGKAYQLFGDQLPKLLDELNEVLAA